MIGRCQGVSVCASVTNRSQRGPERLESWLRGWDLNPRPLGYEPNSTRQLRSTGIHSTRFP
jgi:hypothetical protein